MELKETNLARTEVFCPDCGKTRLIRSRAAKVSICRACAMKQKKEDWQCKKCGSSRRRKQDASRQTWGCADCHMLAERTRYQTLYRDDPEYKARRKQWRDENKDWQRNYNTLKAYGITAEQADKMLADQDFRCASCCDPAAFNGKSGAHIDHCHETGRVRGILCSSCNWALGNLRDDPVRIQSLEIYLTSWTTS